MTDDEEALMNAGVRLRDGIADMIEQGRLNLDNYPDDDQFIIATLREMAELCQRVKAYDAAE